MSTPGISRAMSLKCFVENMVTVDVPTRVEL